MRKKSYVIGLTFSILCIIAGSLIILFLYGLRCESDNVQDTVDDVIEEYVEQDMEESDSEDNSSSEENLIDLLSKAFSNEDVIAYLYFPEANISFPIVQGTDNEKYLETNIWGSHSTNGAIFLDYKNSADFSDTSSIIYGHHMRNGGMFGSLESSLARGIQDKQFTIYTRTNKLVYTIKSTEIINPDDRASYLHIGTYNSEEFISYLKENSNQFNSSVSGDKFVTLLTCHYIKGETIRYGATGVLTSNTTYDKEDF